MPNSLTVFGTGVLAQVGAVLLLILKLALVLFAAQVAFKLASKLLSSVMKRRLIKGSENDEKRYQTVESLLHNVLRYVIYFVAGMTVLDMLGVPIASIITAAGVGGVAIAFGAQSLVEDVITGFFILFEDQFAIGDMVKAGGCEGTVTEVGLRTTTLKGLDGCIYTIPNGEISTVLNYSRDTSRVKVSVQIAYEEQSAQALRVLERICNEANEKFSDVVVKPIEALGVTDLAASGVELTALGYTRPLQHLAVERYLKARIHEVFAAENIEIPYNKTVVIMEGSNA